MTKPADFILTKIIATAGPACRDLHTLSRMIQEGVRVVRINFSHGQFEDFEQTLTLVREAAERTQVPVGVLGDLSGPKIRIAQVPGEPILLAAGDEVVFITEGDLVAKDSATGTTHIPTTYPALVEEVQPGHRVFIDDGNVRMLAVGPVMVNGRTALSCRVTQGGPISTRKGVNLPDTDIAVPAMTDHDRACVDWALAHEVDFLALSFVRRASDLQQLRQYIRERASEMSPEVSPEASPDISQRALKIPIIAKIEKPQALNELEAIVDEADGVMVARGDLGVEMELAQVPMIQKRIIHVAHDFGKPAIVATQMLQSMIEQATPTRAEVSDVANAIWDGTDALMLSGETAVGKYPVQTVRAMANVARRAEAYVAEHATAVAPPPIKLQESRYRTAALAHGVSVVVRDLGAKHVVLWSELGGGARYLSQNRLPVPVVAVSSRHAALRRMSLMFGVTPVWMDRPATAEVFLAAVDHLLLSQDWVSRGDPIVIAIGHPLGTAGVTNELRIHYVGEVCRIG